MKLGSKSATKKFILKAVLSDGTLLETVLNEMPRSTSLIISKQCSHQMANSYTDPNSGISYFPTGDEKILEGRIILPTLTGMEDISTNQDTPNDLLFDIRSFIHKYADTTEESEYLCAMYVLNTWVYDKHEKVPYLRLLGLPGTGKSRLKKVLGLICYHTLDIGFGITEAAMFRSISKYQQGTLLIDEVNLTDSSIYSSIVKILNGGYEAGSVVTRSRPMDYEPETFSVFCPKIIVNHSYFKDQALESRMFTIITYPTNRKEIPDSLSGTTIENEAKELQRKLLAYRLNNFDAIASNQPFPQLDKFSPRVREISLPLVRSARYTSIPEVVLSFINKQQDFLLEQSEDNLERRLASILVSIKDEGVNKVYVGDIASKLNQQYNNDYSARAIGASLKMMGVAKSKATHGWRIEVECLDANELRRRYSLVV